MEISSLASGENIEAAECPNCAISVSRGQTCVDCGWLAQTEDPAEAELFGRGAVLREKYILTKIVATQAGLLIYEASERSVSVVETGEFDETLNSTENSGQKEEITREEIVLIYGAREDSEQALKRLTVLVGLLQEIQYPTIPILRDSFHQDAYYWIVTTQLEGESLATVWASATESMRLNWMIDLSQAVAKINLGGFLYLSADPLKLLVLKGEGNISGRLGLTEFTSITRFPVQEGRLSAPPYLSAPEVFLEPESVSPRADVYNIAATWYSLLLGTHLGPTHYDALSLLKPPGEFLPGVDPVTQRILYRALERQPERRYKSVPHLLAALIAAGDPLSDLARKIETTYSVGRTDVGIRRDNNEDYFAIRVLEEENERQRERGIYLICDGMGGEEGGEIASRLAGETIEAALQDLVSRVDQAEKEAGDLIQRIREVLNEASTAVFQKAASQAKLKRMGTTVVLALVLDKQLYVANVGDSRAYLLKGQEIRQLSEDHTVIAELYRQGRLTAEEAAQDERKGQLTRNLGFRPECEASVIQVDLTETTERQILLLCSDGLHDLVTEEELGQLINGTTDLAMGRDDLLNVALQRGGHDNITVILSSL